MLLLLSLGNYSMIVLLMILGLWVNFGTGGQRSSRPDSRVTCTITKDSCTCSITGVSNDNVQCVEMLKSSSMVILNAGMNAAQAIGADCADQRFIEKLFLSKFVIQRKLAEAV